ncbi:hypothetical protein KC220_28295, partial [Mycobacterium tuberculosis]|nr:hypothetical protein [Mycobacterium tuberculosis]
AHVAAALVDGRLATVPAAGETVEVEIDDRHLLSIRSRQGKNAVGFSYAITDADGTPVMCAAGKRGGKPVPIARTGTA